MCDEAVEVRDVYGRLCRALSDADQTDRVSFDFNALFTNNQRVDYAHQLLRRYRLLPKCVKFRKSDAASAQLRHAGNELYQKRDDYGAWKLYTQAIQHAPFNSENMGLAYANRSAVCYKRELYHECIDVRHFKN